LNKGPKADVVDLRFEALVGEGPKV